MQHIRTVLYRQYRMGIARLTCPGALPQPGVSRTGRWGWRAAAAGLALAGVVASQGLALGQQSEGPAQAPNTGRISLSLGADWASAYYFRGIANVQNGGSNVQPYAEVGVKLLDDVGPLTSLVFAPGIWNNFQYGDEGRLVEPSDPRFWFESDLYLKLSATWGEVLTTGVTYTYYTSPNDSFTTYADVGLKFIPAAFGTWALKAGVQFLVLNSHLETVNTGESFVPIGSVGVAMTY
jgi:hypothetical protein